MHNPETRLTELGLVLPAPAAAVAAYVPYTLSGNTLYVSGQLPVRDGQVIFKGLVGREVTLPEAQKAAELCGLNLLAQAKAAAGGDWSRLARVLKVGAFIASAPDFFDQPKVANGCSELFQTLLGEAGRHARAAVGVPALPLNAAVEIEAIFELR